MCPQTRFNTKRTGLVPVRYFSRPTRLFGLWPFHPRARLESDLRANDSCGRIGNPFMIHSCETWATQVRFLPVLQGSLDGPVPSFFRPASSSYGVSRLFQEGRAIHRIVSESLMRPHRKYVRACVSSAMVLKTQCVFALAKLRQPGLQAIDSGRGSGWLLAENWCGRIRNLLPPSIWMVGRGGRAGGAVD